MGGGKRAVPGRAISTLPPRRGGAPTPVLSPACRSAAVWVERGGTARPREAEWSSGVAAFWGGVITKIFSKGPFGRHYHDVSVLYNKDIALHRDTAFYRDVALYRDAALYRDTALFEGALLYTCHARRWQTKATKISSRVRRGGGGGSVPTTPTTKSLFPHQSTITTACYQRCPPPFPPPGQILPPPKPATM